MLIVVGLMVIPVSPLILDISFVANIMISLFILMVALQVSKPLDFSAFPTVLLLAPLFRLALNVASARVVLVHGHAGARESVVEGTSVAGGADLGGRAHIEQTISVVPYIDDCPPIRRCARYQFKETRTSLVIN